MAEWIGNGKLAEFPAMVSEVSGVVSIVACAILPPPHPPCTSELSRLVIAPSDSMVSSAAGKDMMTFAERAP